MTFVQFVQRRRNNAFPLCCKSFICIKVFYNNIQSNSFNAIKPSKCDNTFPRHHQPEAPAVLHAQGEDPWMRPLFLELLGFNKVTADPQSARSKLHTVLPGRLLLNTSAYLLAKLIDTDVLHSLG